MRALRIALVTAGLMVAGAVFGGLAGAAVAAAWILVEEGFRGLARDPGFPFFLGVYGGVMGAVLGPAAAWLLMRHVPLGLAAGGTTLGTIVGAMVGLLLAHAGLAFYGALAGFGLSAVYLRVRVHRAGRQLAGRSSSARLSAGGG